MQTQPPRLLLVGCGNMGQAMCSRWADLTPTPRITTIDPHNNADYPSLAGLPAGSSFEVVILAVKPQSMAEVLPGLLPFLSPTTLVITIAAGLEVAFYRAVLGAAIPFVRVMPNTPAAIGKGISVAYADRPLEKAQEQLATDLLQATGAVVWVDDENQFHAVTALSGSGPAYVFHLIEAMAEAGVNAGLPAALATQLARQTVIGSAALAESTPDRAAAALRQAVTSPKGTTEAGLTVLMPELPDLLTRTIAKAADRSRELATKS